MFVRVRARVCVYVVSIANLPRFPYIEKSHISEASGNLFGSLGIVPALDNVSYARESGDKCG